MFVQTGNLFGLQSRCLRSFSPSKTAQLQILVHIYQPLSVLATEELCLLLAIARVLQTTPLPN
ncbi:MAG: hypothetical protein WBA89_06265 [Microcoleus sp.]|uniref:hypothetical protein n=1 Tax=Microcoleus sp. TaxID=44472 RepID=UPI003C746FA2